MAYEETNRAAARPHNIILEERSRLSVSGVDEVESFDDGEIIMSTAKGRLIVRGDELHIGRLSVDTGELNVEGQVAELVYEDVAPSGGLFSRLFKQS